MLKHKINAQILAHLFLLLYLCNRKRNKNNLEPAATDKRHKIMTAKAKFEQELNERIQMTVDTMMENKEWRKILSPLSQEAKIKIISMVFLSTAVKEGSEQAFVKAVMSLNK